MLAVGVLGCVVGCFGLEIHHPALCVRIVWDLGFRSWCCTARLQIAGFGWLVDGKEHASYHNTPLGIIVSTLGSHSCIPTDDQKAC